MHQYTTIVQWRAIMNLLEWSKTFIHQSNLFHSGDIPVLSCLRQYCGYTFEHYTTTCLHKEGGQMYFQEIMVNVQCTTLSALLVRWSLKGVSWCRKLLWQIPSMVLEVVDVMYIVALVSEEVFSREVTSEAWRMTACNCEAMGNQWTRHLGCCTESWCNKFMSCNRFIVIW